MRIPRTRLLLLFVSASLLAACGGASTPNNQPVAVEIPTIPTIPTPMPSPDPAPGADPEPTARATAAPAAATTATSAAAPASRPPLRESTPVGSGPPAPAAARAQALFEEGRLLMVQDLYVKACPKFEESQRLDPAVGTLLNLAICEEKAKRKDRACAHYAEVVTMCQQKGQADRERFARERMQLVGCPP